MNRFPRPLAWASALAALASFAVLRLAGVAPTLLALQALAMALALVLAVGMAWAVRTAPKGLALGWALASLLLLALPPWLVDAAPARWLRLGPVGLYLAPLLLPVLLVLAAPLLRESGRMAWAMAALLGAQGLALAVQPDLAQVMAWGLALGVLFARQRPPRVAWLLAGLPLAAALAWAAAQPDPLQPVPHVEQVFALAWARSALAGAGVAAAALAVLIALARTPHAAGLPLAAGFGALWALSLADLTPAPLIGYGAAPWLGFGLLLGALTAQRQAAS